ncbi:hypothetical protein EVAR_101011_1 [Eumeta japonica]|uniref:Uncharacterized protein n=1 Tax=Eumeta variegata TaxID=151549 RepID=A0A4C1ZZ44_EUMVA|nr:hypothetical protein EVAR_101011_1 [Eumeta japonica]
MLFITYYNICVPSLATLPDVYRTKLTCKVLELAPGVLAFRRLREVLELGGILAREGRANSIRSHRYVRTFQHQAIVRPSRLCAVTSRKVER